MKAQNPNVRFWEWINNGWVKLTLKPGKSLTHRTYSTDEEGYSSSITEYFVGDDGDIYRDWLTSCRDCDGPLRRNGVDKCKIDEVALVPAYVFPPKSKHRFNGKLIHRPNWTEYKKTRVHDTYAERMNY